MIAKRLLPDRITIKKPVQSFVAGTKQPIFDFQVLAVSVPARFNPAGTNLSRNVMGQTPKRTFRLFLNPIDLKENYEVARESDGERFTVIEVKNMFGKHLEAVLEEKK